MPADILERIIEAKRVRLDAARRAIGEAELERSIVPRTDSRFARSIGAPDRVNIIAEVKRASPSRGIIRADLDPVDVARAYAPHAAAISVLTEEDFFQGSLDVLRSIHAAVDTPLLRKDFIFDRYQVLEAAAAGADAILLIVAALELPLLRDLLAVAKQYNLDALVEVHTAAELDTVLHFGHPLVGVNNRNLKTFEVSMSTSFELASNAPPSTLLVAESGITTRASIDALRDAGFSAFLVGEHLMRAEDPGKALGALVA